MKLTLVQAYQLALATSKFVISNYKQFANINLYELAEVTLYIMAVETGGTFDTDAANKNSTARGIMQVLSGTRGWMEDKYLKRKATQNTLFVPEYGALIGVLYLAYNYADRKINGKAAYLDWRKAVIAYNQGSYKESAAGLAYYKKYLEYKNKYDIAELRREVKPSDTVIKDIYDNQMAILYDKKYGSEFI